MPPSVALRARTVAPRLALSVPFALAGGWVLARAAVVRGWEARAAAVGVGLLTPGATSADPGRASYHWGLGTSRPHGLLVTPECSNAYVVGPLLLVAAVVTLLSRMDPSRVVVGVALATALMAAVNFVRLVMIAWSIHRFGPEDGFWWAHVVVGSVLSLAGFVAGLAVAIRLGASSRRRVGGEAR